MANIREKVTRVLDSKAFDHFDTSVLVTLTITAFLEAAAEQGWHMHKKSKVTKTMKIAGDEAWLEEKPATYIYRAMLAAAPKFEWDKGNGS